MPARLLNGVRKGPALSTTGRSRADRRGAQILCRRPATAASLHTAFTRRLPPARSTSRRWVHSPVRRARPVWTIVDRFRVAPVLTGAEWAQVALDALDHGDHGAVITAIKASLDSVGEPAQSALRVPKAPGGSATGRVTSSQTPGE